MSAKEYLSRIRTLETYAKQKQEQREEIRELITGLRSMRFDERVDGSRETDRIGAALVRLQEIDDECADSIVEYITAKDQSVKEIQELTDSRYSDLLYRRYVKGQALEKIADEMVYSLDHVKHIHGKALKSFDERYKKRAVRA